MSVDMSYLAAYNVYCLQRETTLNGKYPIIAHNINISTVRHKWTCRYIILVIGMYYV